MPNGGDGVSTLLLTASLALALALGLALLQARRLRRELGELARAVESLGAGEPDRLLPVAGRPRELDGLAGSVNRAVRHLTRQVQVLERRRAELDALLTGLRDGVLALDRQGRVCSCNPAAWRLLGLGPEALGARLEDLCHNRSLQHALRDGWLHAERECELTLESGPVRELRLWTMPLPTPPQSSEARLLAVVSDLGAQHRAERQRRDFVANVSHELKTPITAIRGYVETLLEEPPQDARTTAHFLGIVERQSRRLDAIIDDLLSLSRLERQAGEGGAALAAVPLEPLLRILLEEHEAPARQAGVQLTLELEPGLPPAVTASAPLLERALANLLGNALRYGSPGTEVWVRALAEDRGRGPGLRLEVADQGCGIAPEHLSRLFERFYVVDKARSRELGGTGLGLAIVKHAMAVQGGEVGVESEVGRGSRFWVWLPLAENSIKAGTAD